MKSFQQISRQSAIIQFFKSSWRGKKYFVILLLSCILTTVDFLLRSREKEAKLRILHFADITEIDEGGVFPGKINTLILFFFAFTEYL